MTFQCTSVEYHGNSYETLSSNVVPPSDPPCDDDDDDCSDKKKKKKTRGFFFRKKKHKVRLISHCRMLLFGLRLSCLSVRPSVKRVHCDKTEESYV